MEKPSGCGENKMSLEDGSCIFRECRDYTHAIYKTGSPSQVICRAGPCNPKTEKLTIDGFCEKCQSHTKPHEPTMEGHFTECTAPMCPQGHINGPDGSCRACSSGTIPNAEKTKCMYPFCQGNNHQLDGGKCVDNSDGPGIGIGDEFLFEEELDELNIELLDKELDELDIELLEFLN